MSLLDQLAEKHILAALREGELDNLPGAGHPLQLDDDSHVPPELRAGYRLLKNSGYLPPELEMRREAIELDQLLSGIDPQDESYDLHARRLHLLELRLKQAGMSTDFLRGGYGSKIQQRFGEES
ncbi:DUF1992 domain-containing protein [Erwinia sp. SLM-02]|uniref:DnaJ family domain-containing protein n=1 Tax=Erwinia sp. SLM-02 TaxID=3020057 RepID=UPI0028D474D7|nr:DUF1992 domain-containing protein [uncultured Erwinia sp.]